VLLLFLSCNSGRDASGPDAAKASKPIIAVSIMPQAYFAGRIGGEFISVMVLVGPGQSPHSYEPTPRQMSDLARAAAWVLSGTEFEISLRPKIENLFPHLSVVDGTGGVRFRSMEAHEHEGEEAEEETPGSPEIDRHTWLGLEPAKIMAFHIRDALCFADGANAQIYTKNCEDLVRDMDAVF
jgi:zinc transport system substrate-binding protein